MKTPSVCWSFLPRSFQVTLQNYQRDLQIKNPLLNEIPSKEIILIPRILWLTTQKKLDNKKVFHYDGWPPDVTSKGVPVHWGPLSREGPCTVRCHVWGSFTVRSNASWVMVTRDLPAPWKDRQTDMTENIAFPQVCWRIVNMNQKVNVILGLFLNSRPVIWPFNFVAFTELW